MGFFVIKKKSIIIASICVVVFLALSILPFLTVLKTDAAPDLDITVVIDAGHGGADGGMTGKQTPAKESDINLAIAKKLEVFLKDFGFRVVMTRTTTDGLYGSATSGFKIRDMKSREKIINSASPDLVISIHCNSFPQRSQRGAQVFYAKGSEQGKNAATIMQRALKNALPASDRTPLTGDYFILECSQFTSIIVECGFLSNAEDELLLITPDYQEKVAYAIFCGTMGILIC